MGYVEAIVSRVDLDTVDDEIIDHVLSLRSGLRAMDALDLSTALLCREAMTAMATLDRGLAGAAQQFGLDLRLERG